MTPISLLTIMTETMSTRSSSSSARRSKSSRPSRSTGRTVKSMPCSVSHSQVSRTAACSVATVMTRLRFPSDPRLLHGALERPIQGLRGAAGESDEHRLCDRSPFRHVCARFRWPLSPRGPIGTANVDWRSVRLSMATSLLRLREQRALLPDSRDRSCSLRPRAALDQAPLRDEAIDVRQLVRGPKLTRTKPRAISGGTRIAEELHWLSFCRTNRRFRPKPQFPQGRAEPEAQLEFTARHRNRADRRNARRLFTDHNAAFRLDQLFQVSTQVGEPDPCRMALRPRQRRNRVQRARPAFHDGSLFPVHLRRRASQGP